MSKYTKLSSNNALEDEKEIELSINDNNDNINIEKTKNETILLKVLNKEVVIEINSLTIQSTISDLKKELEKLSGVLVSDQRLIFSGKMLKPDDKTLDSFNISNLSSIHLFPKPVASAIPTATIANISSLRDPNNSAYSLTSLESDLSGSYDSTIGLSSREVKLWSSILLFLSAFTLFNNLSYLTSTGQFGTSIFDSIVNLLDTFCSAGGLYVGNLGMNAARNIELDSIKKYVQSLTILAVLSLLMRYAWVVDVILEVQSTVRKSQEKSNTNTDVDNTTTGSTSTDDSNVPLSGKLVVTFGIQAVIFALVCTAAWLNCVHRAYRFRNAVQTLNDQSSNPV